MRQSPSSIQRNGRAHLYDLGKLTNGRGLPSGFGPTAAESIPEMHDGCPNVTKHVVVKVLGNPRKGPYELQVRSLEELSEWVGRKWDPTGSGSCQLMTAANFPLTQERFSKPTSSRVPLVVHVRRRGTETEKSEELQRRLVANNESLSVELESVRSSSEELVRRVSELEVALLAKHEADEREGQSRPFGGSVFLAEWLVLSVIRVLVVGSIPARSGLQADENLITGSLRALRSVRERPVLAILVVLAIFTVMVLSVVTGHIAAASTIAAHRGDTEKLIATQGADIEARLSKNSTAEVIAWREETRQDLHDYFERLLNVTEMGFAYLKTDIDNRFEELSPNNSKAGGSMEAARGDMERHLRFPGASASSGGADRRTGLRTKAVAGSPEDQLLRDISP
ncbi:hypothetical protein FOZ60_015319 [Perkinsus olseni]|uniref:Uncharacterized protein n=1 Tax=Perkinsus olseni TaxID=32597 RepID=A0A7J6N656_PEROL|nr:hypothetical protein FOZ60_015319 [Perkinsus olseni]